MPRKNYNDYSHTMFASTLHNHFKAKLLVSLFISCLVLRLNYVAIPDPLHSNLAEQLV